MLLKEITFRYTPKGNTLEQAIWDYYAMSALYRSEGSAGHSAGSQANIRGEKRTEIIDNVFGQVLDTVANLYFQKVKEDPLKYAPSSVRKDIKKLSNAWRFKDWMEFHAAFDSIVKLAKPIMGYDRVKKAEINPKAVVQLLSPDIQKLVNTATSFDKTEPVSNTPEEPSTNISVTTPPPEVKKKIIVPPLDQNLPPLSATMDKIKPKRLEFGWELTLKTFDFEWNEEKQGYFNTEKNALIRIRPDNSLKITYSDGKEVDLPNLGLLFRKLKHDFNNKPAPVQADNPAQITENDMTKSNSFKALWDYLYT